MHTSTARRAGAWQQDGYGHAQLTVNEVQVKSPAQRPRASPQNLPTAHQGATG